MNSSQQCKGQSGYYVNIFREFSRSCTRRYKASCKRTQQLPTLLRQQCWELLRACRQWCTNGCNNSQQCWDLQCIVRRIQPIRFCKPCVMSGRGPNNVGRAVQTDLTLLHYASAITEQKKCWKLLAEKFGRLQTLRINTQQHPTICNRMRKRTQNVTSNNVGNCWPTMLRPFARGLRLISDEAAENCVLHYLKLLG